MGDVVLGLVAVVVGAVFCFRGYVAMRLVIPVWGAFVGFVVGTSLLDRTVTGGFLDAVPAWVGGLVVGVVLGGLAYAFYAVAVVLALATAGVVLGESVVIGLDVPWSGLVVVGGLVGGTLLAVLAVVGRLPSLLLVVVTALAGSATTVLGILLLTPSYGVADLTSPTPGAQVREIVGWWLLFAVLAVAGAVVQRRADTAARRRAREQWAGSRSAAAQPEHPGRRADRS